MRTLKQRSKKYLGIFWTNSFLYAPKKTSFPKYYFGMPKKFFRILNIGNILERLQYFGTILKCEMWQIFWTFFAITSNHIPLPATKSPEDVREVRFSLTLSLLMDLVSWFRSMPLSIPIFSHRKFWNSRMFVNSIRALEWHR